MIKPSIIVFAWLSLCFVYDFTWAPDTDSAHKQDEI